MEREMKKKREKQGKPPRGRQCVSTRGHREELCFVGIVEQ